MCGIVGYIGPRDATPIILNGLQRLEYRGYDSAGIAVMQKGEIAIRRDVGKLSNLMRLVDTEPLNGRIGIGHTRWATHGVPSSRNAHPHISNTGRTVVVHNGIVENFRDLKAELVAQGITFTSDTDTEVIVHLVQRERDAGYDVTEATRRAVSMLRGAHAIVVLSADEPDRLVAVRIGNAGGVALGIGSGEMFIASDIPAILEHTRRMVFLESRQMVTLTRDGYNVQTLEGDPVDAEVHIIPYDPVSAERGEYKHFMQKEIHEQARALTDTLRGRVDFQNGCIDLPDLKISPEAAQRLKRMVIVACGTSAYSGLVGKFILEELTRIPVEVDYGSEYRYRDPILDADCAVLAITQSGETVDTLAAMEEARTKGAQQWSIVNALGSQAMRVADGFITMQAGPEIGVASTKAFTTSIIDQYLLALYLAQQRGTMDCHEAERHTTDLSRLPDLVSQVLEREDQSRRTRRGTVPVHEFPLPGTRHQLPDCPGRRAQAEGNQLHSRRRVSRRGNEARPHRADR